ncbi:hypothetical protein [Vibrio phage RYC]|nr:hypothetical protein [Vibrio phage RYC]
MTVDELNTFVRFFLADISESIIPDATLNVIIQSVLDSGTATSDCQEKYYSVKATLEWLIRNQAKGSSGSVGSGAVKKRKERIGYREIEEEYDTGTSSGTASGWDKILEDLLADPTILLCNPFPTTGGGDSGSSGGGVFIGGTGKDRFETSAPWRNNRKATKTIWDDL